MEKKASFVWRIRRGLGRFLCHLCGIETGAEAMSRKRGGATPEEWREAAEALVTAAIPSVLDAYGGRDVAFTPGTTGTALYGFKYEAVPRALPSMKFVAEPQDVLDFCFFLGPSRGWGNVIAAATCMRSGVTPVMCEDGFLRSADTWANKEADARYRQSCSITFDTRGFYFDATRQSTIEKMLNDSCLVISAEQCAESRRLIDRIVAAKLTKYNHQPLFIPEVGRPGRRKVLVVDQSYGDMAIAKGWGSDQTFADMLDDAKRENPDADILVKTHPDTMTGKRGGYYTGVKEEGNVFRVTMPINPYSLMEVVDKVYVCSTQMGFEALMAGKEVHVYGMPFYAGWGLTIDKQKNPRRTNRRTLEEVFYIFYVLYTHWVDIENGTPCTIDKAIDNLIALRDEYRRRRNGVPV